MPETKYRGKYTHFFKSDTPDYVSLCAFFDNVTDDGEDIIKHTKTGLILNMPPNNFAIGGLDGHHIVDSICNYHPCVYTWLKSVYGCQKPKIYL